MKKMLLTLLFFAQPALTAEEALTKCRQIEDIAQRVVCYDEFVDARSPMESSDSVATIRPPELAESSAIPDAQSLFGMDDAEAKRIVQTSMAINLISQIEAKVTDVQKSTYKKLTVTLDNGQIWQQLDNQRMPLKSGETVVVREASLGSFLMEKKSGGRSIRVKRVN